MAKELPKASDVFKNSQPLLAGEKKTFEQLYPQVEDIAVTVIESFGVGWTPPQTSTFDKDGVIEYINCHNASCRGGGIDLGFIVACAIHDRKTECEESRNCIGKEPMGRHTSRKCLTHFTVKLKITYAD